MKQVKFLSAITFSLSVCFDLFMNDGHWWTIVPSTPIVFVNSIWSSLHLSFDNCLNFVLIYLSSFLTICFLDQNCYSIRHF